MIRRHPLIRKIALVVPALILGLFLAEGVVRVCYLVLYGTTSNRAGFSVTYIEHHPRNGWLPIPDVTARHHTTEFNYEIRINDRGFRQNPAPPVERTPGKARIAVLGDSFTFGQGVQEERRFTERLAHDLGGAEVVNLGVPGFGTDQELLLFSELPGPHRQSDLVVLAYFFDNINRNGAHRKFGRYKPLYEVADGSLTLKGVPVPEEVIGTRETEPPQERHGLTFPFKTFLQRHSELYALLRRLFAEPLNRSLGTDSPDLYPGYKNNAPSWQVTRALIRRLGDEVASTGARMLVMLIPDPWHLRQERFDLHQHIVTEAVEEAGLPVLDLTPLFRNSTDPSWRDCYHAIDGHWTEAGHALAAHALARFIREEKLLDD